jgi:Ala-tRNA(Pro) deacylase
MLDKKDLYALLDSRHISYENFDHPAVYTMEEARLQDIPYDEKVVKNLFLRDDKKRNYYLVAIAGNKTVNLKELSDQLQSRKLGFASEADLWEYLKLEKGSVTPVGILNNTQKNVIMVFDNDLIGEKIGIHPMENTATIILDFEDVKRLIEEHGHTIVMCDFDD